jgi:hypothetical protein
MIIVVRLVDSFDFRFVCSADGVQLTPYSAPHELVFYKMDFAPFSMWGLCRVKCFLLFSNVLDRDARHVNALDNQHFIGTLVPIIHKHSSTSIPTFLSPVPSFTQDN